MHVAVIFFGVARGTSATTDHLRRNVYEYNRGRGVSFYTLASLNLVERIDNARTGEAGVPVSADESLALEADAYLLLRQDDRHIAGNLAGARRRSDVYENDWTSIRNSLHQLESLHRAWKLLTQLPERRFDYYLFLRPDLLYLDPIDIPRLATKLRRRGSIALPPWHSYGGFNDRFALADPVAARHYAERVQLVRAYCASNPMHPEMMLAYAMRKGRCKVCALPARAQRVRANGMIRDENFNSSVTDLPEFPELFSYVGRVRFHSRVMRLLQVPHALDLVRFLKRVRFALRGQ